MISREEYRSYGMRYDAVYRFLLKNSIGLERSAINICRLRRYDPERMVSTLVNAGFLYCEGIDTKILKSEKFKDLGLVTKDGKFLLDGRYVFPVKDMMGNILALIGWYPDDKKYITTPSYMFSKECLFYGMERLQKTGIGKKYFLVEGIFDVLSLRSLGLNAVGMMGISSSKYKSILYGLFKRIIAIPDADAEGRKVLKTDAWRIPMNGSYLTWEGIPAKDIDDLCKIIEEDDIKLCLKDVWLEKDRIITLEGA